MPQTNRAAGGRRVDCRWPDRRLTIELDGYRYHNSRYAREQDELRRFTYGDVSESPQFVLAEVSALLERPASGT
jgi:very-short-patch-repair endonuclease